MTTPAPGEIDTETGRTVERITGTIDDPTIVYAEDHEHEPGYTGQHVGPIGCRVCCEAMSAERLIEVIRAFLITKGHSAPHARHVNDATRWWLESHPLYVEAI